MLCWIYISVFHTAAFLMSSYSLCPTESYIIVVSLMIHISRPGLMLKYKDEGCFNIRSFSHAQPKETIMNSRFPTLCCSHRTISEPFLLVVEGTGQLIPCRLMPVQCLDHS